MMLKESEMIGGRVRRSGVRASEMGLGTLCDCGEVLLLSLLLMSVGVCVWDGSVDVDAVDVVVVDVDVVVMNVSMSAGLEGRVSRDLVGVVVFAYFHTSTPRPTEI